MSVPSLTDLSSLSRLSRLSGELRARAAELRDLADSLESSSRWVDWSHQAADAMRRRAARGTDQLRVSAARHDAAADAVDHHAVAVHAGLASVEGAVGHAEAYLAKLGL